MDRYGAWLTAYGTPPSYTFSGAISACQRALAWSATGHQVVGMEEALLACPLAFLIVSSGVRGRNLGHLEDSTWPAAQNLGPAPPN